jgi:hypothetical protein
LEADENAILCTEIPLNSIKKAVFLFAALFLVEFALQLQSLELEKVPLPKLPKLLLFATHLGHPFP